MRTLNLGILAHVDAGKTTLTERLLLAAGVIDEVGSVDRGSTHTDSLALERERGITIKSAVVSFVLRSAADADAPHRLSDAGDTTVNLIDTPGHPDFIAEVERVLDVLDGVVLVVSAVEGVQPQTRVLMRALQRLGLPTLIFVNKIDRPGADDRRALASIADRLASAVVPMDLVDNLGTQEARVVPYGDEAFETLLLDRLADVSDDVVAAYVRDDAAFTPQRLRAELVASTRQARLRPVLFGSAITGAGVPELMSAISELLPAPTGDACGPLSGTVFKVERGRAGERLTYVRVFTGTLRIRDRVSVRDTEARVTGIGVFEHGALVEQESLAAGRIGVVRGWHSARIGDAVGVTSTAPREHFAPPTLETVVAPVHREQRAAVHLALTQLTEQDPLIALRRDDLRQETSISLYGEVQKEVIATTLADEYGVEVTFAETTTICIERPTGTGAAVELIDTPPNPFNATVGLRVQPARIGTGVEFRLGIELGSLPLAFIAAIEDTVHATLRQGLHGWQVTDCTVSLTRSGYWPRQSRMHGTFDASMSSTARDFRNLTPLVLMTALLRAGTTLFEPMHRFELDIPAPGYGQVVAAVARLRGVPLAPTPRGTSYRVEGVVPAGRVHKLQQQLPTLTSGEGMLETRFDHYQPVTGPVSGRLRTDRNPLERREYLRRVQRRE